MSDVKWIKLSTNMFEDEKIRLIETIPDADTILVIWVKLLAQAGKTNATGYIFLNENIPYTDEMLATIFNRPIATVRLALKTFQQFGMIEISENHMINICNWEKHQNIDALEKIRLDTRKRVQKHRDKQKSLGNGECNVTVTVGNETEEEKKKKRKEEEREKETSPKYKTCDMEFAHQLYSRMLENNPDVKKPNFDKWADEFRLIRERDNRTEEQIRYLIDWTQSDSFWKGNILSPSKLRKQFDQLAIKVREEIKKKSQPVKTKPKAFQSLQDWADEE